MKRTIILLALAAATSQAVADDYVQGYLRKDGTYVAPHWRSSANGTAADNYSTQGNYNPYTGQTGTESANSGSRPATSYQYQPYQPYQYTPRSSR